MRLKKQGCRVHGFTIIELLAVIVISSMLMVMALPAFTSMVNGSSVGMAARQVKGELSAARAYAVSKRKNIAVLMPSAGYPSAGIDDKYMNCSMRACVVEKNGSNWEFQYWVSGESWQFLPGNVAIFEADQSDSLSTPLDVMNFNSESKNTVVLPTVNDFNETGSSASITGEILAVIFKPTGRMPNLQRYVKIGEGKFSGSTVVVTNKGDSSSKPYMNVFIDQNSGRVAIEP